MARNKKVADMTPEEYEKHRAYHRNYRKANRERINARQNKRREENPEKSLEACRRFRRENPGYNEQWRLDNPEKYAQHRRKEAIRQAEKYKNDSEYREKILTKSRATKFCAYGGQTEKEQIPRALLNEVRLKCVEIGLDPGVKCHMVLAIIDVQTKYSNMGQAGNSEYHWLHPDDMDHRATLWAAAWRQYQTLRDNFHARNKIALDYICQASNHDEP